MAEGMVKGVLGDTVKPTADEGNGPVYALAAVLETALAETHPALRTVRLTDYTLRILNSASGTAAATPAQIDFPAGPRPEPPSAPAPTSSRRAGGRLPMARNTPS